MKVHFVSTFGDISMEQEGSNVVLITKDLTVSENNILKKMLPKNRSIDFDNLDNKKIILKDEKISKMHTMMEKVLKKDRPTITALKLKDGNIEYVKNLEHLTDEDIENVDDVVTVDKPRRGCPMPEVTKKKEIAASNILKKFLTSQQFVDFEKHRSFISNGNFSGRPYRITSRWSPDVTRIGQVYDMVSGRTICANCLEIPPSEEMLSMKLSIELNEKEFVGITY